MRKAVLLGAVLLLALAVSACGGKTQAVDVNQLADELLEQTIHSANLKDGVWYLMTQFPEMEYSGPEMGVMQ